MHSLVFKNSLCCICSSYYPCENKGYSGNVIFLALEASLRVERVSPKQFVDGDTQHIRIVLPDPLRDGYSSLVNFESLKGMWEASSDNLDMTFASWKRDLFMNPV